MLDETPPFLYGERVSLESLSIEHAAEMVPVLADSSLYEFTGGEPPSETGLTSRYGAQVAGSGNDAEVWLNWIVRELVTEAAIGFIQADVTPDVSELAWVITPSRQRQGFAVEAASMAMQWLRGKGVRRFSAHIHPHNFASQRVAQRIGMEATAVIDNDGEIVWMGN